MNFLYYKILGKNYRGENNRDTTPSWRHKEKKMCVCVFYFNFVIYLQQQLWCE
jgi:hypothetical protein